MRRVITNEVSLSENTRRPVRTLWLVALAVAAGGHLLRWLTITVMAAANQDSAWGLLNKWDAQHYLTIAAQGYKEEVSYAFFPGLPALIRAGAALGLNPSAAGMVATFLGTWALAAGTMVLVQRLPIPSFTSLPAQIAGAIAVTCAPMSMVFAMPYTEAIFGALAVWALVALHDKAWLRAAALVFALGFVRLTAVDMIAAFAICVLLHGRRDWRAWAGLVVAPLPLVGYITWANAHLPRGYFALQKENWNSGFDFGAATWKWISSTLTTSNDAGYLLSTLSMLGVLIALPYAWRKLPDAAWFFSAALAANILLSDGLMHSRPRLLLPAALLVVPWAAAAVTKWKPAAGWGIVTLWALFGTWVGGQMLAVFEWAI